MFKIIFYALLITAQQQQPNPPPPRVGDNCPTSTYRSGDYCKQDN